MLQLLYGSIAFQEDTYRKAAKLAGEYEYPKETSVPADAVQSQNETQFPSSLRGVLTFLFPTVNYAKRAPTHPNEALKELDNAWSHAIEQGVSEQDLFSLRAQILLKMATPYPKILSKMREVADLFQAALDQFEASSAQPSDPWFQVKRIKVQLDYRLGKTILAFQGMKGMEANLRKYKVHLTAEPVWEEARTSLLREAANQKTDLLTRVEALQKILKGSSLSLADRLRFLFKLIKTINQLTVLQKIMSFPYAKQFRAALDAAGALLLQVEKNVLSHTQENEKSLSENEVNSWLSELFYWESQYREHTGESELSNECIDMASNCLNPTSRASLLSALALSRNEKVSGCRISSLMTRIPKEGLSQRSVRDALNERREEQKKARLYSLDLDLIEYYKAKKEEKAKNLAIQLHEELSGSDLKDPALVVRMIQLLFSLDEVERGYQLTRQWLSTLSAVDLELKIALLDAIPEEYPRLRATAYIAYLLSPRTSPIDDKEYECALELAKGDPYQSLDILFAWVKHRTEEILESPTQTIDPNLASSLIRICESGLAIYVISNETEEQTKMWLFETWREILRPSASFNWAAHRQKGENYAEELGDATLALLAEFSIIPSARLVLQDKNSKPEQWIGAVQSLGHLEPELQDDLLNRVMKEGNPLMKWIGALWSSQEIPPLSDDLFEDYPALTKALEFLPETLRKSVIPKIINKAFSKICPALDAESPLAGVMGIQMTKAHREAMKTPEIRILFATLFYLWSRTIGCRHSQCAETIEHALHLVPKGEEILKRKILDFACEEKSAVSIAMCRDAEHDSEHPEVRHTDPEILIVRHIDPVLRNFPDDPELQGRRVELLFWKWVCLQKLGLAQEALELKKRVLHRLKGNFSSEANEMREKLLKEPLIDSLGEKEIDVSPQKNVEIQE